MTIATSTNRIQYAGNDVTTSFSVPFPFFDETDLTVILVDDTTLVETAQVLTTNYTVTGGSGATGTVEMIVAPPTNKTLVIFRDQPYTQDLDLVNNDLFDAENVEDRFDRNVIMSQQLLDKISRKFGISDGDTSGIDLELPTLVSEGILRIDNAKTAIEFVLPVDLTLSIVSSFMNTLLDDDTQLEAQQTLGVEVGVDVQPFDADTLKSDTAATLTAGFTHSLYFPAGHTVTPPGTVVLDFANGNQQKIVVDGAGLCQITMPAPATDVGGFMEVVVEIDTTGLPTFQFNGLENTISGTMNNADNSINLLRITSIDNYEAVEIIDIT